MLLRLFVPWLLLLLLLAPSQAQAAKLPTCDNPYDAVVSVWTWQFETERKNLAHASACLETRGRDKEQRHQAAKRLPAVFALLAPEVDLAHLERQLKDEKYQEPDYVDEEIGKARLVLVPNDDVLRQIYVERQADGKWRWPKSSLDRVDSYYDENLKAAEEVVEQIPDWLKVSLLDVHLWQYLAILLLFSVGFLVRKILAVVVAARVKTLSEKLRQKWLTKLVDVVASPGATLVVAIVLRIGYPQLLLPPAAIAVMEIAVRAMVVISIVWAVYRAVDLLAAKLEARAAETDSKLDDQLVPLVRKTLKAIVFIAGVLFVLQNLNVEVKSLLAGLGIGGLAFALAAKDTLANFFGSLTIFIDRPFQIGDWIAVGKGIDGTVEEVGFRSTRVRTFYDSIVVVPNAKLADEVIDNYQLRGSRRCFVTLGLTYDTTPEQMQAFIEGLRAIIQANPTTVKDRYEIHMSGFGDSALEVMFYIFFKVSTWSEELRQKHLVFLEVMRLAQALGVSFAYPTQTLQVDHMPPAREERRVPVAPSIEELRNIVHGFGPKGERKRPEGPDITSDYMPALPPADEGKGSKKKGKKDLGDMAAADGSGDGGGDGGGGGGDGG